MTQARIAHFCRGFGDVVTAGAQQLGRPFHANISQVLRDCVTDFARENSAQVKWAAAHLLPQHFQRRRVRQIARENLLHPVHSLARQALLAHAEKFGILRRKEKLRHELQGLALVPEHLRRFGDRGLRQARHDAALLHRHWTRRRDHVLLFLSEKDAANLRFKVGFVLRKLVAQMLARKFERHELVMIVCAP